MAIPEKVARAIDMLSQQSHLWGPPCTRTVQAARAALVQAIEQAIADAEVRVFQEHCVHLWNTDTDFCIHCGAPEP